MYSTKESNKNTNQVSVNTLLQPQRIRGSDVLSPARAASYATGGTMNRAPAAGVPWPILPKENSSAGLRISEPSDPAELEAD